MKVVSQEPITITYLDSSSQNGCNKYWKYQKVSWFCTTSNISDYF